MDTVIVADWLAARIDRNSPEPMYRQLLQLMQQAVLSGELGPGTKLPSSRTLSTDLSVARNTVLHVYNQLAAEGYVLTSTGSGTYVADTRPDKVAILLQSGDARMPGGRPPAASKRDGDGASIGRTGAGGSMGAGAGGAAADAGAELSARGRELVHCAGVSRRQWGAFMPGVPDVSEFPSRTWSRLQARLWKEANPELLTYAPGGGYRPLRRALSDYLRIARSVKCTPDQVLITTGIHQSIDLAVRLLVDIGENAWVEDPCYWGVRSVLRASGLTLTPIPIDAEGLDPSSADLKHPPRLVVVTPSHQYPLGTVMSLARRRMLLEYARQHRCWIIEDDYDSEFRYGSRPLASLQGLDDSGRVIYVGSLGKMLFPGMRMGYMVVPEHLVDTFRTGLSELYREGQMMQQAVLAEFIMDGHLTSHVKRMRALYGERRQLLIDAIRARFGDTLPVMGDEAGLHLVLGLPPGCDDAAVTQSAFDAGVVVRPLTRYYHHASAARPGLLLGYACVPNDAIAPAFATLAAAIERHLPTP